MRGRGNSWRAGFDGLRDGAWFFVLQSYCSECLCANCQSLLVQQSRLISYIDVIFSEVEFQKLTSQLSILIECLLQESMVFAWNRDCIFRVCPVVILFVKLSTTNMSVNI